MNYAKCFERIIVGSCLQSPSDVDTLGTECKTLFVGALAHCWRLSETSMGGYFFVFLKVFFVFQPGAAFHAICCILELTSVFCMHFGARISHLRGFWLLALASLGFTWLMAHGFWFHLALVLAVHFTWLLAFVGF